MRATFFFNLSRNIVALQVETVCCAYYHVCDQLVSQQNTELHVSGILHVRVVNRACVNKDGVLGPVQTSNFTGAELNTNLSK